MSFPKSPTVTPAQVLLFFHRLSFSSISITTWFLITLATAAIDTPTSTIPVTQDYTRSPHIIAQFPVEDEHRYGYFRLDTNTTKEGTLKFNHLTIDPSLNRLYAGATNRLFQLDSNLKLEEYVTTGWFAFFAFKYDIVVS